MSDSYIEQLEKDNEQLREQLERLQYLEDSDSEAALKELVKLLFIYPISDKAGSITFIKDNDKGYKSNIPVAGVIYKELRKVHKELCREAERELVEMNKQRIERERSMK